VHRLVHVTAIEDHVGLHLLGREPEILRQARVTHELGAVAADAVIDEGTGSALQAGPIGKVDVKLRHSDAFRRHTQTRHGCQQTSQKQLSHFVVTLSGTGLVRSIVV
jgi:hypothetical protein